MKRKTQTYVLLGLFIASRLGVYTSRRKVDKSTRPTTLGSDSDSKSNTHFDPVYKFDYNSNSDFDTESQSD
ncbi:unnamed protein product [Protopolystoma xenopodis]|uniref:Uncharacterized protein n=1 Tax=Protopolystoma xenopodis TaxID=117903 RepID=A0A3S5FEV2_9PLAT|nr:unnamed protein product [Protopolystoma xenopodis]